MGEQVVFISYARQDSDAALTKEPYSPLMNL